MVKLKLSLTEWLRIGVLLLVFVTGTVVSYYMLQPKRVLPIYNPSDLNPAVVDDDLEGQGRGHRIGNFHLVDQWGEPFDSLKLEGKVYAANFFFTTCPTICIAMQNNFQALQTQFADDDRVVLVSHTVMPEVDTVQTLFEYGARKGATRGKWYLLTGEKEELYRLARRQYFAVMEPGTSFDEHDFIHTENVILVDQKKRIRGFYDGTNTLQMEALARDIALLLGE